MADLDAILANLHTALAEELLKKVQDGSATGAELSVARQMLKDNNVTAVPTNGTPLNDLDKHLSGLPTFEDEDNVVSLGSAGT